MSEERIPPEASDILLVLHHQDGFCTVQAMWDTPEIERLVNKGRCVLLYKTSRFKVFVRLTPKSEKITRELSMNIAKKWLSGEYVKVQKALISSYPPIDRVG